MDKVIGTIIDHNENNPFYIFWVKGLDQKIYEVVTYFSSGSICFCRNDEVEHCLYNSDIDECKVCPTDIRMFILSCMINKRVIVVAGKLFHSEHINPRTRMENFGLSFLEEGGSVFYQRENNTTIMYKFQNLPKYINTPKDIPYRLVSSPIQTPIPDVKMIKYTEEIFIINLPITLKQASQIEVRVNGQVENFSISSSSEDKPSTQIQFQYGKNAIIYSNFTPNGFPTLVLWQYKK